VEHKTLVNSFTHDLFAPTFWVIWVTCAGALALRAASLPLGFQWWKSDKARSLVIVSALTLSGPQKPVLLVPKIFPEQVQKEK